MTRADPRAFYDTVIFNLSLNKADADHEACRALLDTHQRRHATP